MRHSCFRFVELSSKVEQRGQFPQAIADTDFGLDGDDTPAIVDAIDSYQRVVELEELEVVQIPAPDGDFLGDRLGRRRTVPPQFACSRCVQRLALLCAGSKQAGSPFGPRRAGQICAAFLLGSPGSNRLGTMLTSLKENARSGNPTTRRGVVPSRYYVVTWRRIQVTEREYRSAIVSVCSVSYVARSERFELPTLRFEV